MNHGVTRNVPRYLVPFHPKKVPHHFTDILIIGGGLAGLRAAIAVDPSLHVLVITKDKLLQSNSNYAQGGIAGVLDPEDRFENHINDTIEAGRGLCEREVVEMVVREAPRRIRELIEWGTRFDQEEGQLSLGREGGHSHDRIVHALGDATGKEVMRAVAERSANLTNVDTWENTFTIDLLTYEGVCRGALVWNPAHGKTLVWAKQTILCTGGTGQIYRETTNPSVATGDGAAIAYRAGCELRDLEFMQFHPTVLYIAGGGRSLITEAMRGFGAHLLDKSGNRFMLDYDERGELAPRDIVSQAIVAQMEKTRHPSVYLSLGHLDPQMVRARFPGIAENCAKFDIDITRDWIPVRPGAHYMIGGVTIDTAGRTTVPRLWAAGEVTSSGLHGANRLASNSLLEGLVYGAHVGEDASRAAADIDDDFQAPQIHNEAVAEPQESLDLADIRNSLQSLMGRTASVQRTSTKLEEAQSTIDYWCRYVLPRQFRHAEGWELQNLLTLGRLMVRAMLKREESRGVHQRTDFPETDSQNWLKHISFSRTS